MQRGPERILDEYLVASAKAGSQEALDHLVRRWTPRLLRYAARVMGDADSARDIVQETWTSACRNLGGLSDAARFPSWIYLVATRKCADATRKIVRRRRSDQTAATDPTMNGIELDPAAQAEHRVDLAGALQRLSIGHRIVVDLFYSDDLSVDEISDAIGIPVGTVKSRLHQARQILRQHLKGDHDE